MPRIPIKRLMPLIPMSPSFFIGYTLLKRGFFLVFILYFFSIYFLLFFPSEHTTPKIASSPLHLSISSLLSPSVLLHRSAHDTTTPTTLLSPYRTLLHSSRLIALPSPSEIFKRSFFFKVSLSGLLAGQLLFCSVYKSEQSNF